MNLTLFFEFLSNNYLVVIWAVLIGNYITGVFCAAKGKTFQFGVAFDGLLSLIYAAVGYLMFGAFAFFMQEVNIYGISFTAVFLVVMTILIAYKGNSLAINAVYLLGLPQLKLLEELDEKVKEIINGSYKHQILVGVTADDQAAFETPEIEEPTENPEVVG